MRKLIGTFSLIIRAVDPDPGEKMNADPDPQP